MNVGFSANADLAARRVKGRVKEVKEEMMGIIAVMAARKLVEPASIASWERQGDCDARTRGGGGRCSGEENFSYGLGLVEDGRGELAF